MLLLTMKKNIIHLSQFLKQIYFIDGLSYIPCYTSHSTVTGTFVGTCFDERHKKFKKHKIVDFLNNNDDDRFKM